MAEKDEVLSFKVEADVQSALKQMAAYDRNMKKMMASITKTSQKMGKDGAKAAEHMWGANEDLVSSMEDLDDAYDKVLKVQQKAVGLTEEETKVVNESRKAFSEKAKAVQRRQKAEQKSNIKKGLDDPRIAKKMAKNVQRDFKGSLKSGFKNFLDHDAKALAKDFGDLLKGAVTLSGLKLGAKGADWMKDLKKQKEASVAKGGTGSDVKNMTKVLGALGKGFEAFSKAAPLIGSLAGVITKLVEVFIDADEAVKGFNKDVLTGGSTLGFLKKNFNDAAVAGYDVDDALKSIRDSAYDAKFNLQWGTTVEDHKNLIAALKNEGVGLDTLARQADIAGKSVGQLSQELLATAVTYSRNLGVSIQEISALQGEMFTEMGASAKTTEMAFATISSAAADSGISANKFFGILRSMSADLSLFNLRIEEAAKFLGQVSKTMSPRSAQQFMQAITTHFKSADLQTRLKSTLMAGGGTTKKNVQESFERALGGLQIDVETKTGAGTGKELAEAVKAGPKATAKFIAKYADKIDAPTKEAIIDAQRQATQIQSGNLVDLASSIRKLDPIGVMEQLEAESRRMFGKSLDKLSGIQLLAVQQTSNIDENTLDMVNKFKVGLEALKEEMAMRLEKGTATQDDLNTLQRLGIKSDDAAAAAQALRDKNSTDVFKNISKSQQDLLSQGETDRNFAKEQTGLQTTMSQQMGVIADFLKNQLYGVLSSILDSILNIIGLFPGSGISKNDAETKKKIYKSQNKDLIQALQSADFKGTLAKGATGQTVSRLAGTDEGRAKLAGIASKNLGFGEISGAAKMGGVSQDTIKKLAWAQIKSGNEDDKVDLAALFKEANISAEDQTKLLSKILWSTNNQSKLADMALALAPENQPATPAAPTGTAASEAPAPIATPPTPTGPPPPPPGPKPPAAPEPVRIGTTTVEHVTPTGPPPGGAPPVIPVPREVKDFQDAQLEQLGYLGGKNDDIIQVLRRKVKLDKSFVRDELGPQIQESVLKAVRIALTEYKLYKDLDVKTFTNQLQSGVFNPETGGADLVKAVQEGTADVTGGGATLKGPGNAAGGHIIGRNPDGTAKVLRPPAGEMPAFVGPGEAIAPRGRGGGAGNVSVTVNGIGGDDLANMVKVAATNAIYEYKRRENLH